MLLVEDGDFLFDLLCRYIYACPLYAIRVISELTTMLGFQRRLHFLALGHAVTAV